jgi:hypothetical protein
LKVGGTNQLVLQTTINGVGETLTSPSTYNDGKWHLVVGTWTLSSQILYVDGSSVASAGITGTYSTIDRFCIGAACSRGGAAVVGFTGSIDDARLYNRALSTTEVSILYAEGNGALPNPVYPESNFQPTVTGITAGASVWTYTNNDGYTEQMILQTVSGITGETCYGIATTFTLGTSCLLAPNGVMTVTWAVTAPVYTKVPTN